MKKWIISIVMLCFIIFPLTVGAEIVDSGSCGKEMYWTLDSDGFLTISGKGYMTSSPWGNHLINNVVVEEGVLNICENAFVEQKQLQSVKLPEGLLLIDTWAFFCCPSMKEINIPDSVKELGEDVFNDCSCLTSISIPAGLKKIPSTAFRGCTGITNFTVSNDNQNYVAEDGIIFSKDRKKICFYPAGKIKTEYTIPESVEIIDDFAFECARLKKVSIPNTVTTIGNCAFCGCDLESITIPNSVSTIGDGAFFACGGLTSFKIPESVSTISADLFAGCSNLQTVSIPESVTDIKMSAFYGCENLSEVYIPKAVTYLPYDTFSNCISLQSISLSDNLLEIGASCFERCLSLSSIILPNTLTRIDDSAFKNCESLSSITMSANVEFISDNTFKYCYSLESVSIPICNSYAIQWFTDHGYDDAMNITPQILKKHDRVEPTSISTGMEEYWECTLCGELFSDSEGNNEISEPVIIPKLEPEDKVEAFVKRCYKLILGRNPDADGLQSWSKALKEKTAAAAQIIDGFVKSDEFKNRNLFAGESVDILYQTMLGRAADEGGKAGWVDALSKGYSLQHIINGFCGSTEFITLCNNYEIEPGSVTVNPVNPAVDMTKIKAFVSRCYEIILNRAADEDGLNSWAAALASGQAQASQIIDGFVRSAEYTNRKLSAGDSVDVLYKAMLGREADAAGRAGWVYALGQGYTLQHIINGFCGSAEFTAICNDYGISAGTLSVASALVKREAITPEGDEAEAPVVIAEFQSEYTNEEKIKAFVEHCYKAALGREGDAEGIGNYTKAILEGAKSPKAVAKEFVFSGEFQSKLPGNEEFIRILYRLFFDREPGAEELSGWVQMLEGGTSLEEIVNGFAGSDEFKANVNGMK